MCVEGKVMITFLEVAWNGGWSLKNTNNLTFKQNLSTCIRMICNLNYVFQYVSSMDALYKLLVLLILCVCKLCPFVTIH